MRVFAICFICLAICSCGRTTTIKNGDLVFEVNNKLETRISNTAGKALPLMNSFSASEYLVCRKFDAKQYSFTNFSSRSITDQRGKGEKTTLSGSFKEGDYAITKNLEITIYDSFPGMAFMTLQYINTGKRDIEIIKWVNNSYKVTSTGDNPSFWSFQASSTRERRDWILPVDSSFFQKNYMGMNNSDYGGGIPVISLWRKDAGIAIGHVEPGPRMVSLPVEKDKYDNMAEISIEYEYPEVQSFNKGDTLRTFTTFVSVQTGDCFKTLKAYSEFMQTSGMNMAPVEPEAYEAVWCAWGYERRFTVDEILGTLPKVKELGLKWVDIDDGYQQSEGDWEADLSKFPNGNADIRRLVDKIHAMGLKAKLWWAPLAVDPGSNLLRQNPDILLLNKDNVPQVISYWNAYYMSPVYEKTINHTKSVLKMFLEDWDFDGLKMDGGFLNAVPPDYNHVHNLSNPNESYENLPDFFEMIYETANMYKPGSVLQICPCGAAMSFFTMPFANQTVASDPTSSWQTRLKCKTYKALLGKTAYYADHVELSDGGRDFATQVGIGAVLGTKFTWPKDNPYATEGKFVLTPENEQYWKKWISIYNRLKLPEGDYLGELYDIGYDLPEAHSIRKSDTLYYAFYSDSWNGKVELRGLGKGSYTVSDYINDIDYGKVTDTENSITAEFKGSLLLMAAPVK
jgi:alpha-galactosidase